MHEHGCKVMATVSTQSHLHQRLTQWNLARGRAARNPQEQRIGITECAVVLSAHSRSRAAGRGLGPASLIAQERRLTFLKSQNVRVYKGHGRFFKKHLKFVVRRAYLTISIVVAVTCTAGLAFNNAKSIMNARPNKLTFAFTKRKCFGWRAIVSHEVEERDHRRF